MRGGLQEPHRVRGHRAQPGGGSAQLQAQERGGHLRRHRNCQGRPIPATVATVVTVATIAATIATVAAIAATVATVATVVTAAATVAAVVAVFLQTISIG